MFDYDSSLKGGSIMRTLPSRAVSARYPRAFRRAARHYTAKRYGAGYATFCATPRPGSPFRTPINRLVTTTATRTN